MKIDCTKYSTRTKLGFVSKKDLLSHGIEKNLTFNQNRFLYVFDFVFLKFPCFIQFNLYLNMSSFNDQWSSLFGEFEHKNQRDFIEKSIQKSFFDTFFIHRYFYCWFDIQFGFTYLNWSEHKNPKILIQNNLMAFITTTWFWYYLINNYISFHHMNPLPHSNRHLSRPVSTPSFNGLLVDDSKFATGYCHIVASRVSILFCCCIHHKSNLKHFCCHLYANQKLLGVFLSFVSVLTISINNKGISTNMRTVHIF